MSMIVLYVGIIVTFMTVWGVIMVAGFMLGGMSPDTPTDRASNWVTGNTESAEAPLDLVKPTASPE
jgi:hypothetical protein